MSGPMLGGRATERDEAPRSLPYRVLQSAGVSDPSNYNAV